MDDLLRDFVVETSEHLDIVDAELVKFERDPNNSATLALIFRLVHTIKGTCGFLGLPRLEHLAHAAEDVISQFRDGKPVTTPAVTMILKTIDRIKGIVGTIEQTNTEPEGDDEDLVEALRALAKDTGSAAPVASPALHVGNETKGALTFQVLERTLREDEVTLDDLERAFRDAPGPDEVVFNDPEPVIEVAPKASQTTAQNKPEAASEGGESDHSNANSVSKQSVRVAVGTLDRLMTMVSELVLTRNQLLEIARQRDDADFKSPLQRLSHITAELQDGVMQTRMQPIGTAWTKLSRVVRDLTEELGKKIELIQTGAETEIDRQLLEMIKDPLLHMVRNAADHGLEMPEERVALGKPAHGTIHLRAAQESGYIICEVSDDGRGIDVDRVKAKAIRNGMTTEADVARLSDEQILRFVMEPGFSTAAAITNISGRGVGLDVVRSHVEQVGGVVDLRSRPGKGLSVTIKLPLTLAIASALIVDVAGQRFAIPQISVAELVRTQNDGEVRIEMLNGQATLRLRQKLLPVVDVADVLALDKPVQTAPDSVAEKDGSLVVVCQVGTNRFGIVVDQILHTEEIVVKPISSKLRHMSVYSGATILGDGSVILILEPAGVARSVMEAASRDAASHSEVDLANELQASAERSLLLLFRAGGTGLKAIPLAFIGRLEEFDRAKIEDAGGKAVVQYQGRLMPILGYSGHVGFEQESRQPVLVFHQEDREIGMAVDEIVDVVEAAITIDTTHATPGTVGATIIDGKAVEIIDVSELVAPESQNQSNKPADEQVDVLVIEGSEFFRALFAPLLQNAGHRITVVPSIAAARAALARSKPSVIVLDLDQPGDEGFSFVKDLKDESNKVPPIIGTVSRGGPRLIQKGKAAGLHDLVGKFDRPGLLASVGDIVGGYVSMEWGAAA